MTDTRAERARETREKAMMIARKAKPLKYVRGSETSRQAAIDRLPFNPNDRMRVLTLLLMRGESGCTDHQIAEALQMNPSTVRPRRGELVDDDQVVDSGKRRETPSGSEATVWVAAVYDSDQVGLDLQREA